MMNNSNNENNEGFTKKINGGLIIRKMDWLPIEEEHYALYKAKFDLEKLKEMKVHPIVLEKAQEIKGYLDTEEPKSMLAYARKFRSYNQLLMIRDVLQQLWERDGPHLVRKKPRDIPHSHSSESVQTNVPTLYEVTLSSDFCERVNIPQMGTIKLRLPDKRKADEEIRCRLYKFNEQTRILEFYPLNKNVIPEAQFDVSFEPSRFVYKARNYVLINAHALQDKISFFLFPEPVDNRMTKESYIQERNKMINNLPFATDPEDFNQEQKEAIASIVMSLQTRVYNRSGCLLPYIVHGPPGTGKTVTLVEAVRLLLKQNVTNRIVVCTPSNTAADLFAHELLETLRRSNMDCKSVFRMYALAVPTSQIDESLRDNSLILTNHEGIEMFGIPHCEVLAKYRVIICTVMASIYLTLGGLSQTFSHIIIDESGQVSELETLVPIVGLISKDTKIVMAGDHHQLGPVDTMGYFANNNITKSLIERLHNIEYYKDDPRVSTFLRQNYRSHEAIIAVPSKLFYADELITAMNAKPRDKLAKWSALPNEGFPVMWHHIETPEAREQSGTSYMNSGEMDAVISYVKSIISDLHVKPEDIGVVSPYEYQARRLRQHLSMNYPDITVDTVERFQGSQRRVIIVTTVRCNPDDILGFMKCPKRFNTTITRAEELLVVVGNAKTMAHNGSWLSLIQYCYDNDATIGVPASVVDELKGKRRVTAEETSSEEGEEEDESSDESSSESEDEDEEENEEEEANSDGENLEDEDDEFESHDEDEDADEEIRKFV